MIIVRDEIEEIVLSVKSSGNITGWVDNVGTYTITTNDLGNLQVGFKIVLRYANTSLDRDVWIDSIDPINKTFAITGTGITQPLTWEMALYFESGHQKELHKKYTNKAKSPNKRVQEYPLVWLFRNFEETPNIDGGYAEFSTDLQGAIADFSEISLYDEVRIDQKYIPILMPYAILIERAFNTGSNLRKFVVPYGEQAIKLTKIKRPFFGSQDPQANILPDITDAIEWGVTLNWREQNTNCQQV